MDYSKDIGLIERVCLRSSLGSYDPYDIWKTAIGRFSKKLYYKNKYLGIIPAATLTLFDLFLNLQTRTFYNHQEYPVVRGQAALTLVHKFRETGNINYLNYAKKHIDWLLENASEGYSGLCWGTGFEIVINADLSYDSNTPFTTNTPYILEALHEYYVLTKDPEISKAIISIYKFYENHIVAMKENDDILITSYGPMNDRIVTNAVSYTMFAYSIFFNYIKEKILIEKKIRKMYTFIREVQQKDGSWLYAPYDKGSFIDCFHSCFVLKNIHKTSKSFKLKDSYQTVKLGYNYLLNSFYDSQSELYKRFSISNKPSLVKYDLYDNAELLQLAKLLGDYGTVLKLESAIQRTFCKGKDVYSNIDLFGFKRNKNTYRWALMPYILAESL